MLLNRPPRKGDHMPEDMPGDMPDDRLEAALADAR
jgi:hypothetical protein